MRKAHHKLFLTCAILGVLFSEICMADKSGTVTLDANATFSFDAGTADIMWNGVTLEPQGRAALFNLGKYGSRTFGMITLGQAAKAPFAATSIEVEKLVVGDIFGVRTNANSYAKVLVTESSNGSLALRYTTFGSSDPSAKPRAGSVPQIGAIQNNYSYIRPGLSNYGIAPGSIFVAFGSGLSSTDPPVLQSSAAPGLPTTLNQTSLSVTVNGVKTTPAIYYTSATAVAAVLPSNTPVGIGSLTVTYNGTTSLSAPIQVVASAPGLDSLYGSGSGLGVATDANGAVIGFTNSAKPGQTIILWGSGIGGDLNNDDRTYPQKQVNQAGNQIQVFIGSVSATVSYAGRSQFPGLDQYNIVIPANAPTGCFVSAAMMVGSSPATAIVSNAVTLPISSNGGACSDPATGLTGTIFQSLANKPNGVSSVILGIGRSVYEDGSAAASAGGFAARLGGAYYGEGDEYASQGSCTVVPSGTAKVSATPLDIGSLQLSGPLGTFKFTKGDLSLPGSTIPPGTYTFTASGGADIGAFKASIDYQTPIQLTNKAALATVTRSQGVTVSWSGGGPTGDVQVQAFVGDKYGFARVYCHASPSAGQIVIPSAILLALAPGAGGIELFNMTSSNPVTASGLDVGNVAIGQTTRVQVTFK
jgi:uncharacterized protein (TIGR03437 family)